MQASSDLARYVEDMYDAFATGDPSVVDDLLSQGQGILGIGTDPAEWWPGEALAAAFKAQAPEMHAAGMRFVAGSVEGYSDGSVGWFADRPTLVLPNGEGVAMRLTGVCIRANDAWKMVQFHLSIGIPNEEAIGARLTT